MMTLKKLVHVGVIALAVVTAFENSNATTYTFDVDPSSGIGSGFFTIDLPDAWPGNIGRSTVIPAASLRGSRVAGDEWVSLAISLNEPLERANNAVLSGASTSSSGFSVPSSGTGMAPVDAVSALPGVTLRAGGVPDPDGPNLAPTITCPAPATLQCNNGAVAVLSVVVNDGDGNPLVVIWTVDGVKYQTDIIPAGSSLAQTTVAFAANFESGDRTENPIRSVAPPASLCRTSRRQRYKTLWRRPIFFRRLIIAWFPSACRSALTTTADRLPPKSSPSEAMSRSLALVTAISHPTG